MTRRWSLALLLAVVACGVKNRPLPPELVQPEAPSGLVAKSVPDGLRLTWRRPTQYSGGGHMRDLAGFEVERATDVAFTVVGTVILDDQTRFQQERSITWTDTTAVTGEIYRYRIIALTLDHYRSVPSEPVTIEYRPGASAAAAPTPATAKPTKRRRAAP